MVAHALHQSIGGITYQAGQTVLAASRASANPDHLDGYWVELALEMVAEHRRVLDEMEKALRDLAPAVAEAA